MKHIFLGFLLIAGLGFAKEQTLPQNPPPLKTVDAQLAKAQADFEIAKKMFNPWYAGPLITPSAHNVPVGEYVIQPYLFIKNTFAQYNGNRKSVNQPDLWSVNPLVLFQMGWFSRLDFSVVIQGLHNTQNGRSSFYWGDSQLQWGVQLMKETPYRPAVRGVVSETFPTGRYQKLNPINGGADATGEGAYTTTFSLNISKVFWWISTHPFASRLSLNYGFPSALIDVQGFNAYGGGFGTRGRVRPGNLIQVDSSIELSFTQKWVLAIDLVYTYQNHTTFSGHKGRTATGAIASVGAPSNDNLSCAPAIEYNPSANMGFLAGAWFSIIGRNSGNFISGVLSMYYAW
ncbi:MAG: hypothetical protein KDK76_04955 [Chlamydiia bacterium]|nr:hypothetical protein [Chlamydiia bacterium]